MDQKKWTELIFAFGIKLNHEAPVNSEEKSVVRIFLSLDDIRERSQLFRRIWRSI